MRRCDEAVRFPTGTDADHQRIVGDTDGRMREPGFDVYDELGEGFVARAFNAAYNRHYDQPEVLGLLPVLEARAVLDAGCGPGAYFESLIARGAEITGIDGSAEMLRHARTQFGDDVRLFEHDLAEPLDFLDDDSFDVVICALMIHYLADPVPMLREFHRVLRPNGHLIVSTQHPTTDWIRKGGSYFDVKTEADEWQHGEGSTSVSYWRMPLSRMTDDFLAAGFWIERLVEHQPSAALREIDPDEHETLSHRPGFIAFRLRPAPEDSV